MPRYSDNMEVMVNGQGIKKRGADVNENKEEQKTTTNEEQTAASKVTFLGHLTVSTCEALRNDMLKACQKAADKYGFLVEVAKLSPIDTRQNFQIEFRIGLPMPEGALCSAERVMFEDLATHYGLQPSDYGRIFSMRDEAYRIVGINRNRPKYVIKIERVFDKNRNGMLMSADDVAQHLRRYANGVPATAIPFGRFSSKNS